MASHFQGSKVIQQTSTILNVPRTHGHHQMLCQLLLVCGSFYTHVHIYQLKSMFLGTEIRGTLFCSTLCVTGVQSVPAAPPRHRLHRV